MQAKRTLLHLTVFFIIVFLTIGFYSLKQSQITVENGKGWDGKAYFSMYENFRDGGAKQSEYPFCKRIGSPYLAHLVSNDPKTGFLTVNLVSGVITSLSVFLVILLLSERVDLAYFCSLPLLFYLYSPLRFTFYHPYFVDPPALALLSLGILALLYRRYFIVIVLVLSSACFRESGLYYSVFFLVSLLAIITAARNMSHCSWLHCFTLSAFGV